MEHNTTVFLRPNPLANRTDYIRELEKSGMVVMPQQNLAIYTCKTGAKQGPAGPPGEDKNSWWDTIIDAASDEESPITVTVKRKATFRAPYPFDMTEGYVRASLGTAPEGAAFIVDILMNGVSMFITPIHIDAGTETSVGSATPSVLAIDYIPDDAKFEVFVLQIGSTVAGAGLKVAISGIKAAII